MPPPHLDFWPFDHEVGVGVACAKFRLPRPFGFRVRADVRDIRQTDRRTTDADHRLMPPPLRGGGIINNTYLRTCRYAWQFTPQGLRVYVVLGLSKRWIQKVKWPDTFKTTYSSTSDDAVATCSPVNPGYTLSVLRQRFWLIPFTSSKLMDMNLVVVGSHSHIYRHKWCHYRDSTELPDIASKPLKL